MHQEWCYDKFGNKFRGVFTLETTMTTATEIELSVRNKTPVPLSEINNILNEVMDVAVANGANSISMPDDYVAVAHFLCYPEEYYLQEKEQNV